MDKTVFYLRHWLLKHNIAPAKVKLSIEADSRTSWEIERALKLDWDPTQGFASPNMRDVKFFGIPVRLTEMS